MALKTTRLEARLTPDQRRRIERAAALEEESVSAFVVGAAIARAEEVAASRSVTVVPGDYFDRLLASLDQVDPAPGLRRAAERAAAGRVVGME